MAPAVSLASLLKSPGYDEDNLARIKLLLAGGALAFLLLEAASRREGWRVPALWRKRVGGVLAILGALAYLQFLQIGYKHFYHRWDFFYRYLGAKYALELGPDRLLSCVALAESELPGRLSEVRIRKLRDLRNDRIVPATMALDEPEICLQGFRGKQRKRDDARWASFRADVQFFQEQMGGNYWFDAQKGHGFPESPAWNFCASLFTRDGPPSVAFFQLLSALDVGLWAAMLGLIAWAFGWRVLCVSLLFWGLQDLWSFRWVGGGFLRNLWILLLVWSACLLRRRRMFWAGASFAGAVLVKPLVALLATGWVIAAFRQRKVLLEWRRPLAAGALAAALVLVPLSLLPQAGGWGSYVTQIQRTARQHLTSDVGWHRVVAHHPSTRMEVTRDPRLEDPFSPWKEAQRGRLQQHRLLLWGARLAGLLLCAAACWRSRNPWMLLALSSPLPFLFLSLHPFDSMAFFLLPLLGLVRRPVEVALLFAALAMQVVHLHLGWYDDLHAAHSVLLLVLSLFVWLIHIPGKFSTEKARAEVA